MCAPAAGIVLIASYAEFPRLERFFDDFPDIAERDRMRARIAATELFDNVVAHARDPRPARVSIRLSPGPPLKLDLSYKSTNFPEFEAELAAARAHAALPSPSRAPRYAADDRRYRGLGLTMCLAVASGVTTQAGLFRHLVSVVF